MNCIEFESQLHELLDQRQAIPNSPLAEHAAQCAACRVQLAEQQVLMGAVRHWNLQTPSVELTESILAALALPESAPRLAPAPLPRGSRKASRMPGRMLAVAGATLAALLLLTVGPDFRKRDPVPQVGESGPNIVKTHPEPETAPVADLEELVETAQAAYTNLARETAVAVRDAAVFVPTSSPSAEEAPRPSLAPEGTMTWVGGFGKELQPIRSTVGEALGFLWSAVPAEPAPTVKGS